MVSSFTIEAMIKSVFENGYWWVEVDDEAWKTAIVTDYMQGIPIHWVPK